MIGIDVAKEADLGEWYQQVITKGQMISYYDVSNTIVLSSSMWLITSLGRRMVRLHDRHLSHNVDFG